MNYSTLGFPVLHYLPECAQNHVYWVGDVIHHLILCCPLLLLPSIFPSIRVFSNESVVHIRWPNQSFQQIFRTDFLLDWLVWSPCSPRILKGLLKHLSSKASILRHSALFMVQLSHHTWLLEKLWLKTYLFVDLELNNVIVMMYKKYFGLDARAAGRCHSGPRSWNMQGWLQIDFSTDDKDHDSLSWVIAEAALALLMERRADIHLESSWMPRSSHGKRCGPGALGHIFHLWFQVVILFFLASLCGLQDFSFQNRD